MPSAEPAGLRYDELQRRGPAGAWRPVAGIPLLLVIFFAGAARQLGRSLTAEEGFMTDRSAELVQSQT